jgi:hypothetical protein
VLYIMYDAAQGKTHILIEPFTEYDK